MYGMFPRLKERQHTEAGVLSGGEQQMLTLCRTLMGDPDLIIIDEPTEGLAPKIVELVGAVPKRTLKDKGISVLLIEQKLTIAMQISDRALVMGHGSIVFDGTPDSLVPTPPPQGVAGGLIPPGDSLGRPGIDRLSLQRHACHCWSHVEDAWIPRRTLVPLSSSSSHTEGTQHDG